MTVVSINGSGEAVSPEAMSMKIDFLRDDVLEVKNSLDKLSEAITKLALVEQQTGQIAIALERAFKAVGTLDTRVTTIHDKFDTRLTKLELALPDTTAAGKWVDRGVVALATAGAAFIAKATGLL